MIQAATATARCCSRFTTSTGRTGKRCAGSGSAPAGVAGTTIFLVASLGFSFYVRIPPGLGDAARLACQHETLLRLLREPAAAVGLTQRLSLNDESGLVQHCGHLTGPA